MRAPHDIAAALDTDLNEAEARAWDSLARYKFWMFGYWAAIWVHQNRASGQGRPNPFKALITVARQHVPGRSPPPPPARPPLGHLVPPRTPEDGLRPSTPEDGLPVATRQDPAR